MTPLLLSNRPELALRCTDADECSRFGDDTARSSSLVICFDVKEESSNNNALRTKPVAACCYQEHAKDESSNNRAKTKVTGCEAVCQRERHAGLLNTND